MVNSLAQSGFDIKEQNSLGSPKECREPEIFVKFQNFFNAKLIADLTSGGTRDIF